MSDYLAKIPANLTPEQIVRWQRQTNQNWHTAKMFKAVTSKELIEYLVSHQSRERTRYKRFDQRTAFLNSLRFALEKNNIDGAIVQNKFVLPLKNHFVLACMKNDFVTFMTVALTHETNITPENIEIDLMRPKTA